MATNGNGLIPSIKNGIGLAIGVSIGIGGIALVNHLVPGVIPHEFIIWPRGCCARHPHHQCGGCRHHGHHMMAMAGTMNTLGPGPDSRYHLY